MNVKLLTNEQLAEIFKVDLETIDKALETVKVQGESGKIKVYSEEQIEEIKKQFEKQQTAYYEITDLVLKNYEKTQKENDNKDAASIIAALFLASGKEI